jgi:hypothetical protein
MSHANVDDTREIESADMRIPIHMLLNVSVLKDIILSFWGHILYIRNQIPLPISNITGDALQKAVAADCHIRSKAQMNKKLLKFDLQFQSLSCSLDLLLGDLERHGKLNNLRTLAVMIGPSSSSTLREAYYIHFEGKGSTDFNNETSQVTQKNCDQMKRQLIRTMISSWSPVTKNTPITNSFLGLKIKASNESGQFNDLFTNLGDFKMREKSKIKLRKKSPIPFHLHLLSVEEAVNMSVSNCDVDEILNNEDPPADNITSSSLQMDSPSSLATAIQTADYDSNNESQNSDSDEADMVPDDDDDEDAMTPNDNNSMSSVKTSEIPTYWVEKPYNSDDGSIPTSTPPYWNNGNDNDDNNDGNDDNDDNNDNHDSGNKDSNENDSEFWLILKKGIKGIKPFN